MKSTQEEIFIKRFNWKVRFQNPTFWSHIIISFFVPIFTNFGWQWSQMTSWPRLLDVIQQAFSNPVVVVAIVVSMWNCIVDPTTKGVCDRAKFTQGDDTTGLEAAFSLSGADEMTCNVPAAPAVSVVKTTVAEPVKAAAEQTAASAGFTPPEPGIRQQAQ